MIDYLLPLNTNINTNQKQSFPSAIRKYTFIIKNKTLTTNSNEEQKLFEIQILKYYKFKIQ